MEWVIFAISWVAAGVSTLAYRAIGIPRTVKGSGFRKAEIFWLVALFALVGPTPAINQFEDWAIDRIRKRSMDKLMKEAGIS